MHSIIFQISDQPITREERIGIDHIEAGDMTSLDYAYEVSEEERKESIHDLVERILPKGMFTLGEDGDTLAFQGGFTEWRKRYLDTIRCKVEDIDEENVMQWVGPAYQLQKAILNPLATDTLFVTDFANNYGLAERSRELMTMIGNLPTGERLYIGAVVGYHFNGHILNWNGHERNSAFQGNHQGVS